MFLTKETGIGTRSSSTLLTLDELHFLPSFCFHFNLLIIELLGKKSRFFLRLVELYGGIPLPGSMLPLLFLARGWRILRVMFSFLTS